MYGQTGAGKTFTMLGSNSMALRRLYQNNPDEQLSPKSARLNMRRAASSARSKQIFKVFMI